MTVVVSWVIFEDKMDKSYVDVEVEDVEIEMNVDVDMGMDNLQDDYRD